MQFVRKHYVCFFAHEFVVWVLLAEGCRNEVLDGAISLGDEIDRCNPI
jgi:hypothetical protein